MTNESAASSLLPANSSALERALDFGFAELINRIAPPFPELMSPGSTPVEFLPYLAADRGVAEWSAGAPATEKRLTVGLAWPTKRQAGTRQALENAVRGLELSPEIRAWYEKTPRGAPYSFSVRAFTDRPYSEEINVRLDKRLADAKSERDTLSVTVGLSASGTHYIGATTVCGELTTIYPFTLEGLEAIAPLYMAAGMYTVETMTIHPQG
jgi:phage tail P2-like protein